MLNLDGSLACFGFLDGMPGCHHGMLSQESVGLCVQTSAGPGAIIWFDKIESHWREQSDDKQLARMNKILK